jgi:hypothetical protein
VTPVAVDPRLKAIYPFQIRFALPLPQSDRPAETEPTTADEDTTPTDEEPAPAGTPDRPPPNQGLEQRLQTAVAASQTTDGENPVALAARLAALQDQIGTILEQTPTSRRLFPSITTPGTYTSLSPKMARLLTNSTELGSLPTYLGSLNFLDDHSGYLQRRVSRAHAFGGQWHALRSSEFHLSYQAH